MLEMMPWLLLLNVPGVKKKRWKKNRCVQKKIMIPESEISKCSEHEVKSNIGNIHEKKKFSMNILLKFMKLMTIFL